MINTEKTLTIGGQDFPLAFDRVVLELGAIGQGFFHVTADPAGMLNATALFDVGYANAERVHVLAGKVVEIQPLERRTWRVVVKESAFALEEPAMFSLQHPTPADVLAQIETLTGLQFITEANPGAGHYLAQRSPYFYAPGTCRHALDLMGPGWDVPRSIWSALPDGRIWWGDWARSPWAQTEVPLAAELITERDPEARTMVLPYLPRIRPGIKVIVAGMNGEEFPFVVRGVDAHRDKTRIQWGLS